MIYTFLEVVSAPVSCHRIPSGTVYRKYRARNSRSILRAICYHAVAAKKLPDFFSIL